MQSQVDVALRAGYKTIRLEGYFFVESPAPFSMLTITEDITIVGKAMLDGKGIAQHLMFIEDGIRVSVKGLTFRGGNTEAIFQKNEGPLENSPEKRMNIFRFLDGGAISMGEASTVKLEDCTFIDNYSAICGGAISNLGGSLSATNCRFENNRCQDTGAAIDLLSAGSYAELMNCVFSGNEANLAGGGTYGSVTAFPGTFLVAIKCDFINQPGVPIDARPNRRGLSFVHTNFNVIHPNARLINQNPASNNGVRKEILRRFARLLARLPKLVRLEGVPGASVETRKKHLLEYQAALENRANSATNTTK
ncbi:MAG: hypothetical protein O2840_00550 [bacterium]|nr:hypothetical protein [bacterium]